MVFGELCGQNGQMKSVLVLGNQLFPVDLLSQHVKAQEVTIFMREDEELCTYYRFHKHKIIFFLTAMRRYRDELTDLGFRVHYESLDEVPGSYEKSLLNFLLTRKIDRVCFYEIEDKFFEKRLLHLFASNKIETEIWPSPMFLTSRPDFASYLKKHKKPFMKVFYEQQRKTLKILVDKQGNPEGGRWSFDAENRQALPAKIIPPDIPLVRPGPQTQEIMKLVDKKFSKHPGHTESFWLPVDRVGAIVWLENFLEERLRFFGPYEDAIPQHSDFVFHSVLTPFLNTGLLTPEEVVARTISYAKKHRIAIASTEGFIRQVIGWREFIRGIYQGFSEKQETSNFFNHQRKLTSHWYDGTTGVAPLDHSIRKAEKYAYTHHIERLMVIGSLMLLLEVHPQEAHRWFMEMYVDSSDWVMGPNVYGMALFSDGGIFATKPYFCGSNYYRKMGGYKASESWCDAVDGLYWGFIQKHKGFFLKNPRLSMMVRSVEKVDPAKKSKILKAAEVLRQRITAP